MMVVHYFYVFICECILRILIFFLVKCVIPNYIYYINKFLFTLKRNISSLLGLPPPLTKSLSVARVTTPTN